MKRDPIPAKVLATRLIPNVSPDMAKELGLTPDQKSLALITADCDDVTYTALDEATKKADCKVVYAKSFYAGAANANTALAGEIIGSANIAGHNTIGGIGHGMCATWGRIAAENACKNAGIAVE